MKPWLKLSWFLVKIAGSSKHSGAILKTLPSFLKRSGISLKPLFVFFGILGVGAISIPVVFSHSSLNKPPPMGEQQVSQAVLAASNIIPPSLQGTIVFNIPAIFNEDVTLSKGLTVEGNTTLNGDLTVKGKTLDVGNGDVIASNVLYGLTAGSGISIGSGQNPTITNNGVTSFQGSTGSISLSAGSGISISGTTITNSDAGSSQDIFKNIAVGASTIAAGANSDTLTFVAGTGVTLSADTTNKQVTINSTGGLSGLTTNGVLYATGTTSATTLAPGTAGYVLSSNGTGAAPSWIPSSGVQYWQLNSGVLSPVNITNDLSVGGVATSSAKFLVSGTTGNIVATGTLTGLTGLTSSGTIDFSGLGTGILHSTSGTITSSLVSLSSDVTGTLPLANGGTGANLSSGGTTGSLVYYNGSTLAYTGAGSSTQCLLGGNTPIWGSCDLTTNWFTVANGELYPINTTLDFLIGGTGTSSAKFQVAASSGNISATGTLTGLTGLSASGTITFSGLSTGVVQATAGVLGISAVNLGTEVTSTLPVANGGTGATTLTGIIKGNGTGAFTALNGTANYPAYWSDANTLAAEQYIPLAQGGTGANLSTGASTGGVAYYNGSTLALTSAGTGSQCFLGGTMPSWGSCALGTNWFTSANGVLYPINSTLDFLVGGTASSSANFAFLNNAAGTPTASISGNLTLNSAGIIATTKDQPLTIGSSTTGPIQLSPNGNTGLYINAGGNVGIGTNNPSTFTLQVAGSVGPNATDTYNLGSVSLEWNNLYVKNLISSGNTAGFWQRNLGVLSPTNITDDLTLGGTATSSALFQVFGNTGNATTAGTITFNSGSRANNRIAARDNQGLTIGDSQTGNIIFNGGNVGIGTNNPSYSLSLSGNGAQALASFTNTAAITSFFKIWPDTDGRIYLQAGATDTINSFAAVTFSPVGSTTPYLSIVPSSSSNASVGINTSNPAGSFEVQAANGSNHDPLAKFDSTGATDGNSIYLANGSGTFSFFVAGAGSQFMPNTAAGDGGARVNVGQKLFFGDSSNSRMVINSSSQVGIGTTTINAALDFGLTSATNKIYLVDNGTDKYGFGATGGALQLYTGATSSTNYIQFGKYDGTTLTEYMRLNNSGNLGIGTTSPVAPLQVAGTASASGDLTFYNSSNGVTHNLYLFNNSNLDIQTSVGGAATTTHALYIASTGFVGVGTAAPSNLLQVAGTIGIQNSNTITGVTNYTEFNNGISVGGGTTYGITSAGVANLLSGSNVTNNGPSYFQVGSTAGSGSYARLYVDLSHVGDFALTDGSANSYLYESAAGVSSVPSGSLGIGLNVTSPHATLDVEGGNTGGNAALIVNQNGASTNDIFDASASGTTKFSIDRSGDLITASGAKWMPISDSATALQVTNAAGTAFVNYDSTNSRVGIGTTAPAFKLDVQDTKSATDTALFANLDTGTTGSVLALKTGANSAGTSNNFLTFLDGKGEIIGKVTGNGLGGVTYATTGIDFAEYFKKDIAAESLTPGTVVCQGTNGVTACTTGSHIIGVVSDRAGFAGGSEHAGDPSYVLVGLVGQLPVKVASDSGILSGDHLMISSQGVVTKATVTGETVGIALQDASAANNGMIMASVNTSWFDPSVASTNPLLSASQSASVLANIQNVPLLTAYTATISGTLNVLGRTTLTDVGITGTLSDGLISIHGLQGEIDTLAGDLMLQSQGLGGVNILNGLVMIDTSGNITTSGNLKAQSIQAETITATKELQVEGATTGEATLPAGQTSITIPSSMLTNHSKIFVTPDMPVSFGVKEASDSSSFTVRVQSALYSDVHLTWWIVN